MVGGHAGSAKHTAATSNNPTEPRPTTGMQKLQRRIDQWALKRLPQSDALRLSQRNIYVLPTGAALFLLGTLTILLIASINYQANLGFLLTFMLAGCAFMSVLVGHSSLRGLKLQLTPPAPVFAGTPARLVCQLSHLDSKVHMGLYLRLKSAPHARVDRGQLHAVLPDSTETIEVLAPSLPRGIHPCPPLRLQTLYPLGVFRIWALWQPSSVLMVYPYPEDNAPPLPISYAPAQAGAGAAQAQSFELEGLRSYQRGDPLKTIVWKKTATAMATGSGEWVRRESIALNETELSLNLEATGLSHHEAALSRLCAWALAAEAQGLTYGVNLPSQTIAAGRGAQHLQHCLRSLAES